MTTIPGRCHFDENGWLQGPISITHYTSPNHYASGFADAAHGLVQHTEDGFTAGTVATFMSPSAKVSAFFGVGEDGAAQQFLPVGRGYQAWAQGSGNQAWRSCECEDKTKTGQPMTAPQIAVFAQILEACSAYDGFPLQVTDDTVNGRGLITHGDGGVAWGDHPSCPGPVRRAQRPAIVALAKQIRNPSRTYETTGMLSMTGIAVAEKTNIAAVIRETIRNTPGGQLPAAVAAYVNAGDLAKALMPAGAVLYLAGVADNAVLKAGGSAWVTQGLAPLGWLAADKKVTLAQILTATIAKFGTFDAVTAAYLDAGDLVVSKIPKGAQLWVPAA